MLAGFQYCRACDRARPQDTRVPRGALIVVAVGLLACLAGGAARHRQGERRRGQPGMGADGADTADSEAGPRSPAAAADAADRRRDQRHRAPTSAATRSSGSRRRCGSTPARRSATAASSARVKARQRTEIAQTAGGLRATYPRSSRSRHLQPGSAGNDPARLQRPRQRTGGARKRRPADRFTTERGVKLEWPEYKVGTERLKYFIAGGKPKQDLKLPFYTVWKTTAVPAAKVACTLDHQRRQGDRRAPPAR